MLVCSLIRHDMKYHMVSRVFPDAIDGCHGTKHRLFVRAHTYVNNMINVYAPLLLMPLSKLCCLSKKESYKSNIFMLINILILYFVLAFIIFRLLYFCFCLICQWIVCFILSEDKWINIIKMRTCVYRITENAQN